LGTSTIPANSAISLTLTLTNAWTDLPFSSSSLIFKVCSSAEAYLSQGSILMSTLTGFGSFASVGITNIAITQSNVMAGGSNNVTLTFNVSVPTPTGTTLLLTLPKSSYSMDLTSISSSLAATTSSQDSNYYHLTFPSGCDQNAPLCRTANSQYTISIVVNNQQYLQMIQNPLTLQLTQSGNSITTVKSAMVPLHTPLSVSGASISRSILNAYQNTTVSVSFNNSGLNNFNVILSPMVTSAGNVPLMTMLNSAVLTSNGGQSLTYSSNSTNHIIISITSAGTNPTTTVTIQGLNPFFVPVAP
jgi:hypothetical protein